MSSNAEYGNMMSIDVVEVKLPREKVMDAFCVSRAACWEALSR